MTKLNSQLVRMYVEKELDIIKKKIDVGTILPVVGQGQINVLEKFYDLFALDSVSLEDVEYVNEDRVI